jgi:membrane-associated phospholipid phosphatase
MFKNFKIFFLFFLFSAQITVTAQTPYELNWPEETAAISIGALAGISSLYINKNITALTQEQIGHLNINDINGFDRFATSYYSPKLANISDAVVLTALASPALLLISPEVRNDWTTVGTMYAETALLTAGLSNLTKGLFKRTRPYAYNPDAPMSERTEADARLSFFSGHTAIAFSSAVFLSKVYSDIYPDSKYIPYIWSGSLLVATSVGLLRMFSGKHFPTDVLTGAVFGSLIGWAIPELHKKIKGGNVNMNVGAMGIAFTYMF